MRTGCRSKARSPLDERTRVHIEEWSHTPGGSRFCSALRAKLWAYRGEKDVLTLRLGIADITDDEWQNIRDMFGGLSACPRWGVVDLRQADQVLRESGLRVNLRRLLVETGGSIITRRGASRFDRMVKRRRVLLLRQSLLAEIVNIPELRTEYELLATLTDEYSYVVPECSATGTSNWQTFESALRVAAWYFPRARAGLKIPEKSLPTTALGGSKVWTNRSKMAFQNLIQIPFAEAVEVNDQPIQLRGPLDWQIDGVRVAKALPAQPWISLPLRALLADGAMLSRPDGLLFIENHTNFEQVCKHSHAHETWLVIWLEGFPSEQQARLVRRFPELPVAAWCDMDPPGIKIISDLAQKARRPIAPIGMEAELWRGAEKMKETQEKLEAHRQTAVAMRSTTPPELLPLLECFIATGQRVEQEEFSVYDQVLRNLQDRLRDAKRAFRRTS